MKQKHDEGSHACCNARLKTEGGQARCCTCEPHDGCDWAIKMTNPYPMKQSQTIEELLERLPAEIDGYSLRIWKLPKGGYEAKYRKRVHGQQHPEVLVLRHGDTLTEALEQVAAFLTPKGDT